MTLHDAPRGRRGFSMSCLVAVSALLMTLPFLAKAQDAAKNAAKDTMPYSWTFAYKKGDAAKFRQNLRVQGELAGGGGIDARVKAVSKREIKAVSEKGDATFLDTIESREQTINGTEMPDDPTARPIVMRVVTPQGYVIRHSVENAPPGLEKIVGLSVMQSVTPAPDKPVMIGDTWKSEIANLLVEGKKVTMNSKLVGKEKVAGVDALKVDFDVAIPPKADSSEQEFIKVEGSYFVDPKAGRLMRALYNVENLEIQFLSNAVKVKLNGKINLIVPGVNDKEDEKEEPEKTKPEKGKPIR